jgi:hypothetical protein
VSERFFERLASTGRYPGDEAGGETPRAVGRLGLALRGARPIPRQRPLSVRWIADDHGHAQFQGDGTPAHPPLFDREALAFFPFQLTGREWVAAAYVMTRNLARGYRARRFRIAIGGLRGRRVKATASNPLTGRKVPAKVIARKAGSVAVELPLTDSPRLLRLRER